MHAASTRLSKNNDGLVKNKPFFILIGWIKRKFRKKEGEKQGTSLTY